VTSRCNLACKYCPSPKLDTVHGRAKVDMDMDTYRRALEWCCYFDTKGTQHELSLTGIGETLFHPQWRDMIALAREALPTMNILFSTNGLLLDDAACAHLAEHHVGVYISLHRPEKAGTAIESAKRHGILRDVNHSAATSAFDWAGQVPGWFVSAPPVPCEYLRTGWGVVLSDGRITRCCLDASGKGAFGTVHDEPGSLSTSPWDLCGGCHMTIEPPNQAGQ
jgi:hypothetical protein